ncbi:MAG: potassium/proton antiporter [Solirubrobacterales bacterium]|jgi:cell volume regulation protein A|nr:potassium/proton antiporter [Solirubrobacterales bacterium]
MLILALLASQLAGRLRVPGLLLVLSLGILAGSEVTGFVAFSDYELARDVGIVALSLILFEGGLASGWSPIREVLRPALGLATVGTLATALITGAGAAWILDLTLLEGFLLGSILAVTDGAAVFSILRGSTLRRRLAHTLEGEAGMNDPVAVLLVIGFIEWIESPDYGVVNLLVEFVIEMGVGAAVGIAVGQSASWALRNVTLPSAGLYPVATIAAAATAFGAGQVLHGSGFLAVYLTGLAIGSSNSPAARTVQTFHDGLAWVAQIILFVTLGLLVFPSQLPGVALEGLVITALLLVVARPVGVVLGTLGARFSPAETIALSWAGLRGGVPVVLATFPLIAGLENALLFFNVVFFAVLVSTVIQGTTFEWVAARVGVTTNEAALPAILTDQESTRRLGAEVIEFGVRPGDAAVGRAVRELGMPRAALLNVIIRGEEAIPPRGSTTIMEGDRLHVLVRQEVALEFRELLQRWRTGPLEVAQRPRPAPRSLIFSERPWKEVDGDASRPDYVGPVAVAERVRTRRDKPGSLVVLADGRFAYVGTTVAAGSAQAVQQAARRRLGRATEDAERAWWREVIGALAT